MWRQAQSPTAQPLRVAPSGGALLATRSIRINQRLAPNGRRRCTQIQERNYRLSKKRAICKEHGSPEAMLKKDTSPLRRGAAWVRGNSSGPTRKIVSQLFGVGQTAASSCVAEASGSGGVLRSSAPGGSKKKVPMGIKMKDATPEDGSLYDVLQRRISDIRKEGRANTRRNLLKYITDGPDEPGFPDIHPLVFRRKMAQMRFIHSRNREISAAERPNAYVSRWGIPIVYAACGKLQESFRGAREYGRIQPISIRTRQTAIPGQRPESNTATRRMTSGRVGGGRDGPPCILLLIGSEIAGIAEILLLRGNLSWRAGCRWVVVRLYSRTEG